MDPLRPNPGQAPAAPINPAAPTPLGQLPNGGFPPSHNNNEYEFIMNPGKQSGKKPLVDPKSLRGKVVLIVGGGIILMIVIAVIGNILNAPSRANAAAFKGLVAEQQEIIRVAGMGIQDANDTPAKNLAQTTESTVLTQQIQLNAYLATNNIKLTKKEYAAKYNIKTDAALETAKQNNNYDSVFTTSLLNLLTVYANDLTKSYKTAGPNGKQILSDSFNSTAILVKGYTPATTTTSP